MNILDQRKFPLGAALAALGLAIAPALLSRAEPPDPDLAILSRGAGGDRQAILELGKAKQLSATAAAELNKMAGEDNRAYGSAAVFARMVLAKHGDQACFDEIKTELLRGSPYQQADAFEKLAYIGGAEAIKLVAPFLSRDDQPVERGPMDKVFFPPYSQLAVVALGRMAEKPPTVPANVRAVNSQDVDAWRQWWKENQGKYGDAK